MWSGLGYNRRAIWVKEIAEQVVKDYNGGLPNDPTILQSFKGIGEATAGEITAFAFNKPVVIVNEVNIKRVYMYFFFHNAKEGAVKDSDLKPIIEKTCDNSKPREWYYALMDYSVEVIKPNFPNIHKKSASYKKQAPFKESNRELRGKILRFMTKNKKATDEEVLSGVGGTLKNVQTNLNAMVKEGFLLKEKKEKIVIFSIK